MSRPKAVLWDMDGTLIDTEPLWGKATFELGELLGRPLTPEVRAKTIGGSFPNTLSVVAEWAGYELKDGDLERYRTWMFYLQVVGCSPGSNRVIHSFSVSRCRRRRQCQRWGS